jgi:hypothetical protein
MNRNTLGNFFRLSLCMIAGLGSACSQEPAEIVADWEEDGWSKFKTHGVKKEFVRQGKLASEKAKSIQVTWIERGKPKSKIYSQSTHYYTALRFFCEDGDQFVIVMRKRK